MQPLRQRSGLDPDPSHHQAELAEEPNQCLGLTRHPGFSDDPSGAIHHAHAALFQRHVDPGIMLHGCPSTMLGADPFGPRSHHHPEGQPPAWHASAQAHYGI